MIVLMKPSTYDDEGYVLRHFRGVLPNNTLACLSSLTEDLNRRRVLGRNLEIRIRIFEDTTIIGTASTTTSSPMTTTRGIPAGGMFSKCWHGCELKRMLPSTS
jgi:hypothetical protein